MRVGRPEATVDDDDHEVRRQSRLSDVKWTKPAGRRGSTAAESISPASSEASPARYTSSLKAALLSSQHHLGGTGSAGLEVMTSQI